jgi:type I restriction enzyme S subunit
MADVTKWTDCALGDVVNLKRGYDLPERDRMEGEYPIVSSSGVTGSHNVAMVKGPGVVTGRYGTLGQVFYISGDFWPLNTSLYVQDFKGNHPLFIRYLLQTLDFGQRSGAAAVPGVNRNALHMLRIKKPDLSTQQKIAAILSAYDDLIENNLRRIKILEEMTQNLYCEWFVKFRFPDHEHARFTGSMLGRIPERWEVVPLGKLMELRKDKFNEQQHSECPLLDLAKMQQRTLSVGEMGSPDELTTSRIVFEEDDILFGSIRPYLHKVALAPCRGITNVSVLVLRPADKTLQSFLAVLVSSIDTIRWADQHSTGTKMPVIKWETLQTMPVLLPSQAVLRSFETSVQPMLQTVKMIFSRNQNLRRTRDLLLPRLISGEVDVSELDIVVPEEVMT